MSEIATSGKASKHRPALSPTEVQVTKTNKAPAPAAPYDFKDAIVGREAVRQHWLRTLGARETAEKRV